MSTKWIDIGLSQPNRNQMVLCWIGSEGIPGIRMYQNGSWFNEYGQSTMNINGMEEKIVYWTPIDSPY